MIKSSCDHINLARRQVRRRETPSTKISAIGYDQPLMRALKALVFAAVALSVSIPALAASPPIDIQLPYTMTVRVLNDSAGLYQVEVDDTNPLKSITSFVWTPPGGMEIKSIVSTIGGTCRLSGADNTVACAGDAAPPGGFGNVGGSMLVTFVATGNQPTWVPTSYGGYYIHYGVIGSVSVHEVAGLGDLPLCKKGQTSTRAHPCAEV